MAAYNKNKKGLAPRQEAFCYAYAACGNATRAYEKAGYKIKNDNSAAVSAKRLLRNAKIKAKLQEIAKDITSQKIMDIAEIQERLSAIARQDSTEEYITMDGKKINKRVAAKDALKAMELLGKMQGAFVDNAKINVSGELQMPVIIKDDI